MRASTKSRPRVSVVVSVDADDQVEELPDLVDDRTSYEGKRWRAVREFARAHHVRIPPESGAVFIVAGPPATAHECAFCTRPIELGARARLDAVLPTTFVHEACRLHEHLGEWARWQNPKQ